MPNQCHSNCFMFLTDGYAFICLVGVSKPCLSWTVVKIHVVSTVVQYRQQLTYVNTIYDISISKTQF